MIRLLSVIIILASLFPAVSSAQSAAELKREGDKKYLEENYPEAEETYRKSLSEESRAEALFNLGNSLYQQGKFDEAAEYFSKATEEFDQSGQLSDAHYNLGNALFEKSELGPALEAYRKSLIHNPDNRDARNNFMLTKQMLSEMPPQESSDDGEEGGETGEEEKESESPGMDEEIEGDEDTEGLDDPGENGEDEEGETDDSIAEADESELDEEMLEQLLRIAEEGDQQSRRKMNEEQKGHSQTLKDW
nr:tetratricopeptide repeat protein [Saprospiraceae bacterium]